MTLRMGQLSRPWPSATELTGSPAAIDPGHLINQARLPTSASGAGQDLVARALALLAEEASVQPRGPALARGPRP